MLTLPEQQKFEETPAGTHIAVCFQIIDLGSQISAFKDAKGEHKVNHKIRVGWELSNEHMKDGRPFAVGKDYTLSSNDRSNLVSDINAWRGKPFTTEEFGSFDISKLLGKACMLQVENTEKDGKIRSKVKGVMAMPKGAVSPVAQNPMVKFDLSNFDQTVYDALPEWIRKIIASSPEYIELHGSGEPSNAESANYDQREEIPF